MKINKLFRAMALGLCMIVVSPVVSISAPTNATIKTENTASSERAQQLVNRLEEIKALDKDQLSKAEKKQLRHEVKEIKKELASVSGGVYLSIGAIIIIILLLILLL